MTNYDTFFACYLRGICNRIFYAVLLRFIFEKLKNIFEQLKTPGDMIYDLRKWQHFFTFSGEFARKNCYV